MGKSQTEEERKRAGKKWWERQKGEDKKLKNHKSEHYKIRERINKNLKNWRKIENIKIERLKKIENMNRGKVKRTPVKG